MTILQTLEQQITPQVLQSQNLGDSHAHQAALSNLYQVLLVGLGNTTALKRVQTHTVANEHSDGDALLTALLSDENRQADTQAIYEGIANQHGLSVDSVRALALTGVPLAYQHIKAQADTAPIDGYLAGERNTLLTTLPAWLVPLVPVSLLVSNPAATATHVAQVNTQTEGVLHKEAKQEGSFAKALLPIIGAIILAGLAWMLLKSCQKDPAPIASPAATVAPTTETTPAATAMALTPATLSLALDGAGAMLYACDGTVGNDSLAQQVRAQVAAGMAADVCQFTTSTITANEMPAAQYVPQILGFMKGVPDASAFISGTTVLLNASNADALQTMLNNIKAALPADYTVEAEPMLNEAEAITQSLDASMSAIEELTDTSTIDALVHALNLQIINFAVDSAEIPAENQAILDKAAARLIQLPNAHLVITGHTDNTGSMAYNQDLSERRAKAVHDYLVAQGVADDKLEYLGASYTRPVASNATEQGRFKNRRIAFRVHHNGTEVATIATAPVANAPEQAPEQAPAQNTEQAKTSN